ncbi:amidohydrolase [Lentinus tigrinus ALCF2SS1-7]|uniref:Amidohydrolase n=1 Tax=Lentinus tigrinus ALCF2SS1-6 TaxID=1328759 RepID=A0A5C2SUX3_9APHY|nr:amidohydrolase [Lentinus tigrinus ALCF2SS1-6]RPD80805.1 amidohydrolase [Lentinus tigrinus ALCF2SS1-7]
MSQQVSPKNVVDNADVQAGCWTTLFGLRKRYASRTAKAAQLTRQEGDAELPSYVHYGHGWYDFNYDKSTIGSFQTEILPEYSEDQGISPEVLQTIQAELKDLSAELRELSLDIWHHPEIMYEEKYAHDRLTKFMTSHGFKVTPHYLGLETAWRAEFTHRPSEKHRNANTGETRVIGVNSEMDALPGIGHACGHNLIAMSGVAVSLAIKAALQKHDMPGTILLLGTPAEEAGGGKITLLERGAYKEMDACIMSHPTAGPDNISGLWQGAALQPIEVEFYGHGAHAGYAPWEAQNALDAAFVAYASISALRQQIKPDCRVHGIIVGREWVPNIIPDYAKLRYMIRAPTYQELDALRERVRACFDAAALATACKIEVAVGAPYYEVRNNQVLGREYARLVSDMYGMRTDRSNGAIYSTDFGNVTYALPALHPAYAIPTEPNGANHTPQFTKSVATQEAHEATLKVAAGLAALGFKVLQDADFTAKVKKSFDEWKAGKGV